MQENSLFLPSLQTSAYNGLAFSQELDFCVKNQVPAFEIFFDGWMPFELKKSDFDKIFAMKQKGIQFSVHAPIQDYLSKDSEELINSLIDFCNKIEATLLTVHFDKLNSDLLSCFIDKLHSTKLSIENTIPDKNVLTFQKYPEFIVDISKKFDIYATVDIGHAVVNGYEPISFISNLLQNNVKIDCFHLHNNDGVKDLHYDLTAGIIDYKKILDFVFSNQIFGHFVFEHWTNNLISKRYFEDILKSQK